MATTCDRCAKSVKRVDDVITCMGFCEHVLHLRCANVDKNLVKIITESANLHWMCDECVKLMKSTRFRNTMASVGDAINELTKNQDAANSELKKELAKHSEQIARLSNQISSSTPLLPVSANRRAMKRRRVDNGPETAKPLLGGTRSAEMEIVATVPPPTNMFWIYLSRLHPTVKSDVVEKLTRDGLKCESAKAIPLVKQGTDVNSLNFISFKVGVDPKYRIAAMDPSSWPKGILFREFEDTQAKNYWMPDPNTPSIAVPPESEETPQQVAASMDTIDC